MIRIDNLTVKPIPDVKSEGICHSRADGNPVPPHTGFILNNINLTIPTGRYFVLLGPTGAGKSVFLETIAGLLKPTAGTIRIDNTDITDVPIHKRRLGMVFQQPCLFTHKNVHDNIAYALGIAGCPRSEIKQRVHNLAEEVSVTKLLQQYPSSLSGGERQRVALARTLIGEPRYLLLDEPLSAIDTHGRAAMRNLLGWIQRHHKLTVLHVTHDFEDAMALADEMAVMNQGAIVETGTPEQLFSRPGTHFAARFLGNGNVLTGEITSDNGQARFVTRHNRFSLPPQNTTGQAYVMIAPENIVLARTLLTSSARNCVRGRIDRITLQPRGVSRVEIDAGDKLTATVLTQTIKDMNVTVGDEIFLAFKSSAVHVIEHYTDNTGRSSRNQTDGFGEGQLGIPTASV